MTSSVGLNAMQTFASVRAGITRSSETSIFDKRFEPFVMALLPDDVLPPLEPGVERVEGLTAREKRMLRLATFALREAMQDVPSTAEIPLFLGVPAQIPDRPLPVTEKFITLLCAQARTALDVKKSRLFGEGRAAGLVAIKAAMDLIASGEAQHVLVGGVDTFLDLYMLGLLDSENRILSATTMDGFIPGEGAAFLLLGKSSVVGGVELAPLARVPAAGTGFEKGHRYSEEVYKGDGLAEAFTNLFADCGAGNKIKAVYAGLNGENFSTKEWGVAYLRLKQQFDENHRVEHPADCFGDPGAALGCLMAGLAVIGMAKNVTSGPCVVWCSSDYGQRAAIVVDRI